MWGAKRRLALSIVIPPHMGKTIRNFQARLLALITIGTACLMAVVVWDSARCRLEVELVSMKQREDLNSSAEGSQFATLRLRNKDSRNLGLEGEVEAKVGNKWIPVGEQLKLDWFEPGMEAEIVTPLPHGSERCRICLEYRIEAWRWRVWDRLGLGSQRLVNRIFPGFMNRVLPAGQSIPAPSHWKKMTIEPFLPHGGPSEFDRKASEIS
jgi:hypothetical protein